MAQPPKPRELLDVPLVNPFESKLDITPRSRPQIGPVQRSNLLSKLHNFLPEMQQANQQLAVQMEGRPAQEFDLEHFTDSEEEQPYIEMDLACGVLELKDASSLHAAERAVNGQLPEPANDDDDDDSDDSDDFEEPGASGSGQKQGHGQQGQQGAGGQGGSGGVQAGQQGLAPGSAAGEGQHQGRKRLAAKRKGNPKIQEL